MPDVYVRRRMYVELGGYVGYMHTPVRELQEVRLSIIAELNYQAKQEEELKEQQEREKRRNR